MIKEQISKVIESLEMLEKTGVFFKFKHDDIVKVYQLINSVDQDLSKLVYKFLDDGIEDDEVRPANYFVLVERFNTLLSTLKDMSESNVLLRRDYVNT